MGEPGRLSGTTALRLAVVAAIASITQIALTIAYASLVFRDELVVDLQLGLTAMFAGLFVAAIVVALRSGLGGHVSGPQDSGLVVLSVVAPSIAAATDSAGETIVVLMGLSSVAVGLTLLLLGRFGLGRLVRFLPYPVLAGFLAGTGLVMARSTIELAWSGISGTATGGGDRAARVVVAVAITAAMTAISRSSRSTERLMPVLVLGSIIGFHVVWSVGGLSRVQGAERGWLLPELPGGALVTDGSITFAGRADWGVVFEQLPSLAPLLILAPLTLLLYLGALESVLDVDLDTDREFRVVGSVNIVGGALGSAPSYTQFANTMLVQQMAGRRRAVPVMIGVAAVVVLAVGDRVVALAPQPVVAGMLGFIAASFVLDWLWDLRRRVSRIELLLAGLIAVSIPAFGFLTGVALGLVLAAIWFVVQYSRISGVRRISDAEFLRSNVHRAAVEHEHLRRRGREVLVVTLDGYLFFGTGDSVARAILERQGVDDVRHVILDLSRVTGADSSAVASFGHLVRWAEQSGVSLTWAGVRPNVRRAVLPLLDDARAGHEAVDLDRALESTEAILLMDGPAAADAEVVADTAGGAVAALVGDIARQVEFDTGDAVMTAGERDAGLVIVLAGWVTVLAEAQGARRRQLGPGSVLGEISLYRDGVAGSTVVAAEPVTVLVVDRSVVSQIESSRPKAAAELHRLLAEALAERLVIANDAVDAFHAADTHTPDA